jgi:hypothetical protein
MISHGEEENGPALLHRKDLVRLRRLNVPLVIGMLYLEGGKRRKVVGMVYQTEGWKDQNPLILDLAGKICASRLQQLRSTFAPVVYQINKLQDALLDTRLSILSGILELLWTLQDSPIIRLHLLHRLQLCL